ncbi:ribonuclease E/G [uncultured Sphingomonas sp.]|uniref:ribonuclease E/G n=1 Tax=uncultured Sphingomonas sp. TaxID=158754 RepID=UPI0035CB013F
MTTRMLIDARHREETRVAVVQGNRIEEFDFESAERKQLKGNIYLAKVTRVEPSLQAAFVDYGGNRHGFLAFSEIHPDYYQIPKEDREALLREEAEHAAEEAALLADLDDDEDEDAESIEAASDDDLDGDDEDDAEDVPGEDADGEGEQPEGGRRKRRGKSKSDPQVEALRERRSSLRQRYKIQDVIRRRQVLLVQIVKEERGNKGAALTTYLSLAGRYCVLMPNTSHGGGISRKISNAADRKRLKSIMAELQLPPSMGCIVRTAGLQRTKVEIKRDFDYLARLWDGIREKTLESAAPALVYGDSDLIKRAIRDIYNRDIEEIVVEGAEGYAQAREFMKMLMPSHARRIQHYSDPIPLFQRAHVEDQLAAMYHPVVQLKSGGYLVINPTEALVSIDINSGRSTREHNIEQTATATNLEAAAEIARQLRLRDMAGLVVIDFIDMDNGSNVRKVEKAMKDALKNDRARIQVGRISSFGLLEMSRQRLRTGVLEASSRGCPHCEGTGLVRTASSAGLSALRLIEDEAARGRGSLLTLRASQEAAIYVLNRKRADIAEIEDRYGVSVEIFPDREEEGARMSVEASGPPPAHAPRFEAPIQELDDDLPEEIDEIEPEVEDEVVEARSEERQVRQPRRDREEGGEGRGKRRRRRGRRGRGPDERDEPKPGDQDAIVGDVEDEAFEGEPLDTADVPESVAEVAEAPVAETGEGRRRRGRRGGRRRRSEGGEIGGGDAMGAPSGQDAGDGATDELDAVATGAERDDAADIGPAAEPIEAADAGHIVSPLILAEVDAQALAASQADAEPGPKRRPRARKRAVDVTTEVEPVAGEAAVEPEAPTEVEEPAPKPKRSRRKTTTEGAPAATPPEASPEMPVAEADMEAEKPKRRAPRRRAAGDAGDPPATAPTPAPATASAPAPANDVERAALEVGDDGAVDPAEAPAAEDAGPPRRGWWQRTFGA